MTRRNGILAFRPFKIGRVTLAPGKPLLMGILNVTPDSFSDGNRFFSKKDAVGRALAMADEGADIIDVGGESTRPGARPVPVDEEMARVIPVIKGVRRRSGVAVSIDTMKPETARAALDAGADMVNDVSGFRDSAMVALAAEYGVPSAVMHMRGDPRGMQKSPRYKDVVAEVKGFLKGRCAALSRAGVRDVIIDPGVGFGKTVRHNLALLAGLDELAALGRPVLVGASRKSFIGKLTGAGVEDRLPGTLAAHLRAVALGAAVVRAHDVAAHRQALDVWIAASRGR